MSDWIQQFSYLLFIFPDGIAIGRQLDPEQRSDRSQMAHTGHNAHESKISRILVDNDADQRGGQHLQALAMEPTGTYNFRK